MIRSVAWGKTASLPGTNLTAIFYPLLAIVMWNISKFETKLAEDVKNMTDSLLVELGSLPVMQHAQFQANMSFMLAVVNHWDRKFKGVTINGPCLKGEPIFKIELSRAKLLSVPAAVLSSLIIAAGKGAVGYLQQE